MRLPQADVLLHAGDVCNQADSSQIDDFLDWISQLDFRHKIIIRGNHDIDLKTGKSLLDVPMPSGVTQLDHGGIEIDGLQVWGVPAPKHDHAYDWSSIPESTNVLLTHYPPYSILDKPPLKGSKGNKELLSIVKSVRPDVHLFGHIHAGYGQLRKGKSLYINGANCSVRQKKIVNKPVTFELNPPEK